MPPRVGRSAVRARASDAPRGFPRPRVVVDAARRVAPSVVVTETTRRREAMLDDGERRAMTLSTLAGLATTLGAVVAVWKKPDARAMAFLLGVAIGVMTSLSFVELYAKNVIEHGFWSITAATLGGGGDVRVRGAAAAESRGAPRGERGVTAERTNDDERDVEERR